MIALRQKLGLAPASLWAPVVGTANEVVWEIDYPDLTTFQRENEAFYADPDAMKQWRRLWQHAVQSSTQEASSPEDTQDGEVAYGRFPPAEPRRYREGLLPD